ncbi:MAG: T9SS type A sorting domain-containing protein [Prolixibacteraceae bacterium]|nr:T9SS type A sorting domain-containing protein [Prolixibacteraceae bacterium]
MNVKKFLLIISFLMSLNLFSLKVFSQDPDFYVFLCFGQSNMEGQGTIEPQDKQVDSRFKVMEAINCSNLSRTKGNWYTAVPPLTRCYTGLSPADYFGRTMVANLPANKKVGIINVSVAGCKIELYDKDNYQTYSATVESWMKNIINEYGGNPYGRLVELAQLAQKDGVIKGILLHQGESNTGDNQWTAKVKKVYDNLMADLSLNPDSIPLLAGEVVNADQGGICAGANTMIAKLPQVIPNSHVISSKGCTDATDNLHFNSAGYRELGKRYGEKMLSILGYVPDTSTLSKETAEILNKYSLEQNYPNPVSKSANISFSIPDDTYVSLKVYNILGVEVKELAGKAYTKGKHNVMFETNNISEGLYFYTLKTNKYSISRKMIIRNK